MSEQPRDLGSSKAREKLLLVAKAFPPAVGGVETYSEQVCRQYAAARFDVTLITRTGRGYGKRDLSYPEGSVRLIDLGGKSQVGFLLRLVVASGWLFLRNRFARIHCTTWRPALGILRFSSCAHLTITVHGREVLAIPPPLKRVLRLVVSRADTIVCVSDATRKALRSEISAAAGKAVVAFNGLTYRDRAESRDYQCAPEDAPIEVISFARFVARKNLARCLLAVAALRNRGVPGFRYTIAGSGPLEEELRTTSEQLGLGDVVRFTGRIPDDAIPELYERAAIFLHPQIAEENGKDMEGFGIVIADAMSFGCAVVVGQEGGPRDFVRHGVTGLIVDGTDLQAIVASLESLIIDGEMRDRIGRAARSYALAELSWSKHVKGVLGCPEAVTIEETGAREALDVAAA